MTPTPFLCVPPARTPYPAICKCGGSVRVRALARERLPLVFPCAFSGASLASAWTEGIRGAVFGAGLRAADFVAGGIKELCGRSHRRQSRVPESSRAERFPEEDPPAPRLDNSCPYAPGFLVLGRSYTLKHTCRAPIHAHLHKYILWHILIPLISTHTVSSGGGR